MNIAALLHPHVPDRESLKDFARNLIDQIPGIERNIARLKKTPNDKYMIAELFRSLHNIKGDATICQLEFGVMIAHPIETLLARLRDGEIEFSELLAEVVLLAMDRLELAVEALESNRTLEHLKLVELVRGLEKMSKVGTELLDERSVQLIEAVTGFRPALAASIKKLRSPPVTRSSEKLVADLRLFRSLSQRFEARSPLFEGRSQRLRQLALDTNLGAGKPVDPAQLEAAVYMHDIGMMFLPESIWLKVGKLSEEDKLQMQDHPLEAAGLLERMEGWQEAAIMVAQHHEMPDGGGYPKQLKGDSICAGAKILAIVDAFESVTLKHRDRGLSRSILRAIAEVNACDKQFAPEWIAPFNAVIRRMLES
jgi:response regulator RpfG family c-di-GMP phosphodiesterase